MMTYLLDGLHFKVKWTNLFPLILYFGIKLGIMFVNYLFEGLNYNKSNSQRVSIKYQF